MSVQESHICDRCKGVEVVPYKNQPAGWDWVEDGQGSEVELCPNCLTQFRMLFGDFMSSPEARP